MSKALQLDLIDLGYGDIVGTLDGIIGKNSKKAIKKLQSNRKLLVDGIVGKQTLKEIEVLKKQAGFIGTRNFDIEEFRSPDTKLIPSKGMDSDLILKLERLRYVLGNPTVIVTSGYRTPEFNHQIGGYVYSNHLTGEAADIKVIGVSASEVHKAALDIFEGVGKYRYFTHVDVDSKRIRFTGKY